MCLHDKFIYGCARTICPCCGGLRSRVARRSPARFATYSARSCDAARRRGRAPISEPSSATNHRQRLPNLCVDHHQPLLTDLSISQTVSHEDWGHHFLVPDGTDALVVFDTSVVQSSLSTWHRTDAQGGQG